MRAFIYLLVVSCGKRGRKVLFYFLIDTNFRLILFSLYVFVSSLDKSSWEAKSLFVNQELAPGPRHGRLTSENTR